MGNYAQCWPSDFYVGSSKNGIDPGLIGLFREADKRVVSDPRAVVPGHLEHWLEGLEDEPPVPIVYYTAPIHVVRDRLHLLGYTLSTSREAFERALELERQDFEEWSGPEPPDTADTPRCASSFRHVRAAWLSELTVDSWLAGLREIRRLRLKPNHYGHFEGSSLRGTLGYQLSHEWYGSPGWDRNVALRLAIEACPDTDELLYDVTDLVASEYVLPDEDLVEYSLGLSAAGHQSTAKIILLTEGKSDSAVLREALEFLYPHLSDYYSFMEFDLARVGGGAGNLANLVKSFAGAGIVNRTIALFDNDTAAAAALKVLDGVTLPPHIRVLQLPDIESLRTYPTIGPTGSLAVDVNGLAASVELFLGGDVLTDGDQRIPVQWTGFDSGMRRYQGEVLDKV